MTAGVSVWISNWAGGWSNVISSHYKWAAFEQDTQAAVDAGGSPLWRCLMTWMWGCWALKNSLSLKCSSPMRAYHMEKRIDIYSSAAWKTNTRGVMSKHETLKLVLSWQNFGKLKCTTCTYENLAGTRGTVSRCWWHGMCLLRFTAFVL